MHAAAGNYIYSYAFIYVTPVKMLGNAADSIVFAAT